MNEHLQRLLDAFSDEAPNTDNITNQLRELGDEDLTKLDEDAIEAFYAIRKQDNVSADDMAKLELVSQAADAVRAESTKRVEEAQAREDKLAELDSKFSTKNETEGGEEDPQATQEATEAADQAPVLVTASGTKSRPRVDLAALAAKQPADVRHVADNTTGADNIHSTTLVAAADVPDFAAGQEITSINQLARAVSGRFAGMPIGTKGVAEMRRSVAILHRNLPAELVASGDRSAFDVVEYAANESRLPGGSLTAAAGWCTPSEVDYALCDPISGDDGYVDLPTIQVTRGGLRYPSTPDFSAIYDLIPDQILCEPEIISGIEKECVTVPCPTWIDHRLCVAPFCVQSEILMEKAFPEMIQFFLAEALKARRRRINAYTIAQMADASTDVPAVPASLGASGSVLDAVALLAAWYRDLNRTNLGFTLEIVAPHWLREVVRSDISKRRGVGVEAVSNADIDAHFRVRGVRVQWVYDWQTLAPGTGGPPPVHVPPSEWPTEVQILIFAAGAFVKGVSDVIRLDAVYDSASLKQNIYTKLFFEDALAIIPRCYQSLNVTIPLCINGAVGPEIDLCAATP